MVVFHYEANVVNVEPAYSYAIIHTCLRRFVGADVRLQLSRGYIVFSFFAPFLTAFLLGPRKAFA